MKRCRNTKRPVRRQGNVAVLLLLVVLVIAGLIYVVYYFMGPQGDDPANAPLTGQVFRGQFQHVILREGDIEATENIEIRCNVKSRGQGSRDGPSTTILDVIPEGTKVSQGDWLFTLDASPIEDERTQQQILVNNSNTLVIQAKAVYETAVVALQEYLEGTYQQERKLYLNELFLAEERHKKALLACDSIKKSVDRGLVTELQLEGEQARVEAAKNDMDLAQKKVDVLDNYTMKKMKTQLESDIEAAKAQYENTIDNYATEQRKLKLLEDQIANCRATAPVDGFVVYANVQSRRREFVVEPGAGVRQNQAIVRLPSSNKMQVNLTVDEARVSLVRAGMPVAVRVDAAGDQVMEGKVARVNQYAEAESPYVSANSKEYKVLIDIIDPPSQLRGGMSAEAQIHVQNRDDVLQMPFQAVYKKNRDTFCLVKSGDGYATRRVVIQTSNDRTVAIDEEASDKFTEGELVVLNPRRHEDKFDFTGFPDLTESKERDAKEQAASANLQEVADKAPTGNRTPPKTAGPKTPSEQSSAENPGARGRGARDGGARDGGARDRSARGRSRDRGAGNAGKPGAGKAQPGAAAQAD